MASLPLHVRLLDRIPAQGAAFNDACLGVAMVGQREVVNATEVLAQALQSVSHERTQNAQSRRRSRQARPDWSAFDAALRDYVVCCREDLGIRVLEDKQ